MKIHSKYFKEDIEVNITEVYDEKNPEKLVMNVISHDSLRDLYLNSGICNEVECTYIPVFMERNHYAVLCSLKDRRGKTIQEIGESMPSTLVSKISKDYPILIAYQRAFDRALIAFLGFDGKVLSDTEVPQMIDYSVTEIPKIVEDDVVEKYEASKNDSTDEKDFSKNISEVEAEKIVYEDCPNEEIQEMEPIITSEIEDEEPVFEEPEDSEKTEESMENINTEEMMLSKILNGKKWNQKVYGKTIYLDGEKVNLTEDEAEFLKAYIEKNKK